MKNENAIEGAFPVAASYSDENPEVLVRQGGLTKRECFAAMAMQGMLASANPHNSDSSNVADCAIIYADALLKKLDKPIS